MSFALSHHSAFPPIVHSSILNMEFQMIWLVTTTVTAYTIYRLSVWLSARLSRPPYPPGPRGIPLLGNVLYPTENLHTAYLALGNTYGKGSSSEHPVSL